LHFRFVKYSQNSNLGLLPTHRLPWSRGRFQALDSTSILSELASAASRGQWDVVVRSSTSLCSIGAGSQNIVVSSASILFKLSFLKMYIGASQARQVMWISDSSVTMTASFGGFGRNRVVSAEISSQRTGVPFIRIRIRKVHTTTGFDSVSFRAVNGIIKRYSFGSGVC